MIESDSGIIDVAQIKENQDNGQNENGDRK